MTTQVEGMSYKFIWARIHSLLGLGIVIFLVEHLLTNSQAALWIGQDGIGFIRMVNWLHSLPYLHVLEISLLGVPILFHAGLGIRYAIMGRMNSFGSDRKKPILSYGRNHAYSWQRLTSWVLLIGIILHVINFRFLHYPIEAKDNRSSFYLTRISMDKGLYTLSDRLNVRLFNHDAIANEKNSLAAMASKMSLVDQKLKEVNSQSNHMDSSIAYEPEAASIYDSLQRFEEKKMWVTALEQRALSQNEVIAVCDTFGTATLLNVRDTFKDPIKGVLYTIFVLAAVFHGFNGLWTFLITWGAILKMGTQRMFTRICLVIMLLFGFLGLAAIWGSYWINLRS